MMEVEAGMVILGDLLEGDEVLITSEEGGDVMIETFVGVEEERRKQHAEGGILEAVAVVIENKIFSNLINVLGEESLAEAVALEVGEKQEAAEMRGGTSKTISVRGSKTISSSLLKKNSIMIDKRILVEDFVAGEAVEGEDGLVAVVGLIPNAPSRLVTMNPKLPQRKRRLSQNLRLWLILLDILVEAGVVGEDVGVEEAGVQRAGLAEMKWLE